MDGWMGCGAARRGAVSKAGRAGNKSRCRWALLMPTKKEERWGRECWMRPWIYTRLASSPTIFALATPRLAGLRLLLA